MSSLLPNPSYPSPALHQNPSEFSASLVCLRHLRRCRQSWMRWSPLAAARRLLNLSPRVRMMVRKKTQVLPSLPRPPPLSVLSCLRPKQQRTLGWGVFVNESQVDACRCPRLCIRNGKVQAGRRKTIWWTFWTLLAGTRIFPCYLLVPVTYKILQVNCMIHLKYCWCSWNMHVGPVCFHHAEVGDQNEQVVKEEAQRVVHRRRNAQDSPVV